jgi:putative zinc finger/helix-turn-helix YgiT family protein
MAEKRTLKKCPSCGKAALRVGQHAHVARAAGVQFSAALPALVCGSCGEAIVEDSTVERFELLAARELARMGIGSSDAFRFMRKALGMTAAELARVLDVTPETVSRWETGKVALGRSVVVTLASLVADRIEGRDRTLALATAQDHPAPRRATVELDLAG